jgi:excisionase family DNA binding protein
MNGPVTKLESAIAEVRRATVHGQSFEPLLNDSQAAQLLGNMHPRTLQRLARTGIIPAIKIGRSWFFRASALDAWVNSQVESVHRPCFSTENE